MTAFTALGAVAADPPGSKILGERLENGRALAFASTDLAPGRLGAAVVCLDGRPFAVAAIMGHGNTATPAIGIVQVYEERRPVGASEVPVAPIARATPGSRHREGRPHLTPLTA